MPSRIQSPALLVPDALKPLRDMRAAVLASGVDRSTFVLVHLRVSQLNGRPIRVPTGNEKFTDDWKEDRRLEQLETWRESDDFSGAERAALALAEAATLLDRDGASEPVSDEVWDDARRHFSEKELGALVVQIGLVNLWNRVNIVTGQDAANWLKTDTTWVPMTSRLVSP